MARLIDADKLKEKYPDRKSLNQVLDAAPTISITEQIEGVKAEFCDSYCKMPFKYSAGEWEEIVGGDQSPCINCPLNRL